MPLGLHLGLRLGQPLAKPSVYAVETRRVLARYAALGVPASAARAAWLDEVVIRPIVADGILAAADRIHFPGRAHSELAARVNLASPGTGDLVPSTPASFTADVGYTCDGVDDFFLLGLTVSTTFSLTKWKQDSACLWARASSVTSSVTAPLWGQSSGTSLVGLQRSNSNNLAPLVNGSGVVIGAAGTSGTFLAVRRNATHVRGYIDGAFVSEQASTSQAPAANRTISAMRNSTVYAPGVLEALGFGEQLSDEQITALQAVITAAWAETPPA
jgi:hypothetical protein